MEIFSFTESSTTLAAVYHIMVLSLFKTLFQGPQNLSCHLFVLWSDIFVHDLISFISYLELKVRSLTAHENFARIPVYVTSSLRYENYLCTKVQERKSTNFYAYENFCDCSRLLVWLFFILLVIFVEMESSSPKVFSCFVSSFSDFVFYSLPKLCLNDLQTLSRFLQSSVWHQFSRRRPSEHVLSRWLWRSGWTKRRPRRIQGYVLSFFLFFSFPLEIFCSFLNFHDWQGKRNVR